MHNIQTKKRLYFFSITALFVTCMIMYGTSDCMAAAGEFENPIGYSNVNNLLAHVLTAVQGVIATLAVLMLVIGGIMYMTSAGDQGRVQTAKSAITAAIIGFAIALAGPTFLREIYDVLGVTGVSETSGVTGAKPLSQVILDILQVIIGVTGGIAVLMLVIGGILYMISGGDQARSDTAKNTIKYALIGLVVALLSLVIVNAIHGALS